MECEKESDKTDWVRRALTPVIIVVACVGVTLAVLVVLHNTRRIRLGRPPVRLTTMTVEQEFKALKHSMQRRLARIERRFVKYRTSVPKLEPRQDSLATLCVSRITQFRSAVAVLDTADPVRALRELKPELLRDYRDLVEVVSQFVRTFASANQESDSLDRELLNIISE
ncbi:MAG: hypothetical protein ABIL25_09815 [candidate division WOR-3 bacterium]